MMLRLVTLAALGLGVAVPAMADPDHDGHDRDGRDHEAREHYGRGRDDHDDRAKWDDHDRGDDYRVWVEGHVEKRETRIVTPAVIRQDWVPDRLEEYVTPAVTERVRIAAVTERVWCPAVMDRYWVPEVRERVLVPGHYDVRIDAKGREYRVWVGKHNEDRIVREGRFEERLVREGFYEERIVTPERWQTRVITPERREVRCVEKAHYQTVIVRPERTEVTVEKVWVPGRWEIRPAHPRA